MCNLPYERPHAPRRIALYQPNNQPICNYSNPFMANIS